MPAKRPSIISRAVKTVLIIGAVTVILFIFVEGTFSILWVWDKTKPTFVEHRHTRYDPTLGWAHIPGKTIPNMYGPGNHLTINDQGFRAKRDFDTAVPPGKIRVMCSGDSFTLGVGVGDDDTFCAKLEHLNPAIQAINMGQGGYSLGQIYLHYEKNGRPFDHHLHLVSFVTPDFTRMGFEKAFHWYYRPIVEKKGRRLVAENIPVPRNAFRLPLLNANIETVRELRSIKFFQDKVNFSPALKAPASPAAEKPLMDTKEIAETAMMIFQELDRVNREKNSRLVLVYLPMKVDYFIDESAGLRNLVRTYARQNNIALIDLYEELKKLPKHVIEAMYNDSYHYSPQGNEWVARQIHARLEGLWR